MKHLFSAIVATALFASVGSSVVSAEASGPAYFQVKNVAADDMLNIRTQTNHKAQRIGRIPPTATCVLNMGRTKKNLWWKIKYGGVIGFVNGKYLTGSDARCGRASNGSFTATKSARPVATTDEPAQSTVALEDMPFAKTYPVEEQKATDFGSIPMAKTFAMPAATPASAKEADIPLAKTIPVAATVTTSAATSTTATNTTAPATPKATPANRPTRVSSGRELGSYVGVIDIDASGHLNVRSEPAVGGKKVGQLPPDANCMRATRRNSDASWIHIEHNGLSGWVSSQYLGSVDKYDCFLKHPRGL